jgi:hypothetical protein
MLFHSSIQKDLATSFGVANVVFATILKMMLVMSKLHRTEGGT